MVFLEFRNKQWQRLMIHEMVLRLQRFWRYGSVKARRQALAMGGHPRLGMNSPIVGDIVAIMVMLSLI
jgi:hypothetical protein